MPVLFAPLTAINIVSERPYTMTRKLTQLSTVAGKFSLRAHAVGPVGSHAVHLDFTSVEEIDEFWDWYDTVLGAFLPFWMPTYQRDFVPLASIGAADLTFNIRDRGYSDLEFPDVNRRTLVAVLANHTLIKRDIAEAISNGDGTETLTLSSALGVAFTQGRANGICHLLHCRLNDDKVSVGWWSHDIAEADLTVIEVRDAPLTGATL
jgi:hypothetical protein